MFIGNLIGTFVIGGLLNAGLVIKGDDIMLRFTQVLASKVKFKQYGIWVLT